MNVFRFFSETGYEPIRNEFGALDVLTELRSRGTVTEFNYRIHLFRLTGLGAGLIEV